MDDLVAAAGALFPAGWGGAVAAANPRLPYPLMPGEALPGARPARLREFSAGRHAARRALVLLRRPPAAIPIGADRAPRWPEGVAGTISHSARACLAAMCSGAEAIGLDLEEDNPLPEDLFDTVLTGEERRRCRRAPDPGRAALRILVAKEAAYKAQYPRSRTVFGFDVLRIEPEGDGFVARFLRPVPGFAAGEVIPGRWARAGGHVLAAAWLGLRAQPARQCSDEFSRQTAALR